MNKSISVRIAVAGAFALGAGAGHAHFKLIEPASWIVEDERGDPQKIGPCGGTLDDGGTRTGAVTELTGGQMLRLVVDETIYHPGHYRVALARRMNWLPPDPVPTMQETERGLRSDRADIETDPEPPVLIDGLWEHYERFTGIRETEIAVPNIDCEGCFLQVIQFMSDHPGFREGGFSYHHCAIVNITADPDRPAAAGW